MTLHGIDEETVRDALRSGEPLPGTRGFAGRLSDGRLVRDVLGRYPLFSEPDEPSDWAFAPTELAHPKTVPAGCIRTMDGDVRVWSLPEQRRFERDREAVETIENAIRESLTAVASLPVGFSGGVDSAVLASATDGPLYTAGFPESHDLEAARDAARRMDREVRAVELSVSDVERAVPEVARAIGRTNAMDVGIALPLFLLGERVAADGRDRLAIGQGADELFGGYAKVAKAPDDHRVSADTVRDAATEVLRTLPDQLERDVLALRAVGVEPVTPLLDDRVVRTALRLPGHMLVDGRGERKVAFRRAARAFVPDPVAFREKKAIQYGSLVARELDRLARQAGFKRRMDDHVSRYVESRLE